MRRRFRLPMAALAALLLGLIAVLATLQYRWLGRVSDAERERMTATLNARASAFAQDFDRELTLAYTIFQIDPGRPETAAGDLVERFSRRYERWQTTARQPRLVKEYYAASREGDGPWRLHHYQPETHAVTETEWPASLQPIRAELARLGEPTRSPSGLVIRTMPSSLFEQVPALLIPAPPPLMLVAGDRAARGPEPDLSCTILVLDAAFIAKEILPALAQQHFHGIGEGFDYQMAVVGASGGTVYQSTPAFAPKPDATADASAELFQVRPQEFGQLVADVRRFVAGLSMPTGRGDGPSNTVTLTVPAGRDHLFETEIRRESTGVVRGQAPDALLPRVVISESAVTPSGADAAGRVAGRSAIFTSLSTAAGRGNGRWRLLVKHPSGSLEAAVNAARRRNLMISGGILGVLAASLVLIVASSRRSQELARQQMEFVAAVSHELRTPLAVIRSAGDNLADGVVRDDEQIRKYGALVRGEGRRLTEMVEQILEYAGLQSGQRTMRTSAVDLRATIASVLQASGALIDAAGLIVDTKVADDLPAVAGDEDGLRRVFQNLVGNAIKYGADGGGISIVADRAGGEVRVVVRDRGIGIAPADHARIFEPFYRAADVVSAQIQGAGLGLSLVQRIVAAHGGRITVKSAKGAGSEFTVFLPIAAGDGAREGRAMDDGRRTSAAPAAHLP